MNFHSLNHKFFDTPEKMLARARRCAFLNLGAAAGRSMSSYQIARSLRFRSGNSANLSRTLGSPTNQAKWTYSLWIKRSVLTSSSRMQLLMAGSGASDTTRFELNFCSSGDSSPGDKIQMNGGTTIFRRSNEIFRDTSAWMHVVLAVDTTQGTEANKLRCYVNNIELTWATTNAITTCGLNANAAAALIGKQTNNVEYFDGYVAETNFVDGQQLTPSSFGKIDTATGTWSPIKYAGAYGNNGFYLDFSDNSGTTSATLGADRSGNGNNWTPSGVSVTAGVSNDSFVDTPTNYGTDTGAGGEVRGNYCTWSNVDDSNSSVPTFSNGNLTVATNAANLSWAVGTQAFTTGKWYFEATFDVIGTGNNGTIGLLDAQSGIPVSSASANPWNRSDFWGYYGNSGNKFANSGTSTAYGAAFTAGDVIGIAFDVDNGNIWFSKNGTWQNSATGAEIAAGITTHAAFSGVTGKAWKPAITNATTLGNTCTLNAGQRPFANAAPSGYKALCTQNLPDPTIKKPNAYFDATLYAGSASTQSIVNAGGFQPDLVWIKDRSNAQDHKLTDSARGVTKALISDSTAAETTDANGVTAFNSNGFSIGAGTRNYSDSNLDNYVAWQWKTGATPGFDVQAFSASGATVVNHNLGVTPAMVIIKNRASITPWYVHHRAASLSPSAGNGIQLNGTAASGSGSVSLSAWSSTTITTVAGIQSGNTGAILFAQVAGFSKFDSYTGNGSANGPFVWCGFRPRWIMIKRTDSTGNWVIIDTARQTYNILGSDVWANLANAEGSDLYLDVLASGFKVRATGTDVNASSGTYIYAAFAESPFKYARGR